MVPDAFLCLFHVCCLFKCNMYLFVCSCDVFFHAMRFLFCCLIHVTLHNNKHDVSVKETKDGKQSYNRNEGNAAWVHWPCDQDCL